jgi:hypothetical protein
MSNEQSFLATLSQDLGVGTSVEVRHLPKHARQNCDVIYGPPAPLLALFDIKRISYT